MSAGEYVRYTVVALEAGLLGARRRVLVQAVDANGDAISWTAQPDRVPLIGAVVEVNMRPPSDTNPPPEPQP